MHDLASKLLVGALIGYVSGAAGAALLARRERAANLVGFGAALMASALALVCSIVTLIDPSQI
jgi:hypothetical protein